jgi:hypothetical protein
VITKDVPDESLAVARGKQVIKEDWAKKQKIICVELLAQPHLETLASCWCRAYIKWNIEAMIQLG